jgi:hypothetical protein
VVINYDGSSPSGFKSSTYKGMTTDCAAYKSTATKAAAPEPSILELNSN